MKVVVSMNSSHVSDLTALDAFGGVPAFPGLNPSSQPKTGPVKRKASQIRRKLLAVTGTTMFVASFINFSGFSGATANAAEVDCTPTTGFTNCKRFTYSGADQTFTVPAGAISMNVRAWGANSSGGGGFAMATLTVIPGSSLTIRAGQAGLNGSAFGGGGFSFQQSGGGMSAVFDGQLTPANVQLVAGGGGGSGSGRQGGSGGGSTGGAGLGYGPGTGGSQTAGGGIDPIEGGTPGQQFQGGTGRGREGGGGGGGYYGGGGGGSTNFIGSGGGGGSSFVLGSHVTGGTTTGGSGVSNGGASDTQYAPNGGNGSVVLQWVDLTGPTGAKGDTGAQGDAGAAGAQGNTGTQGDAGAAGAQGNTGTQGDAGAAGAKGDTGLTGRDGTNGVQGDKGETGAKGDKGDTGSAGASGSNGSSGVNGGQGVAGSAGRDGVSYQGLKGDTGASGPAGNDGKDGKDGAVGAAGVTGATGATGATGQLVIVPGVIRDGMLCIPDNVVVPGAALVVRCAPALPDQLALVTPAKKPVAKKNLKRAATRKK